MDTVALYLMVISFSEVTKQPWLGPEEDIYEHDLNHDGTTVMPGR
jgi:hypothetical protein